MQRQVKAYPESYWGKKDDARSACFCSNSSDIYRACGMVAALLEGQRLGIGRIACAKIKTGKSDAEVNARSENRRVNWWFTRQKSEFNMSLREVAGQAMLQP